MSHFQTFAIAGGSGLLGSEIVAGLRANNAAKVIVLSRSAGTKVPEGVEVRVVDFESVESITEGLKGVDVSVSVLAGMGAANEPRVAQGAKAAGVKLHIPNEFGADIRDVPYDAPIGYKRTIREWLDANDQPALHVAVGLLYETWFVPQSGFDFVTKKVKFIGSPDTYYCFTRATDVGSFLGALLTSKSSSELLALGDLTIAGDRLKVGDIIPLYESSHPGQKLEIDNPSIEEAQDELPKLTGGEAFSRWMKLKWAKAGADVTKGGKVELDNGLVEGWEPVSVKEYLAKL